MVLIFSTDSRSSVMMLAAAKCFIAEFSVCGSRFRISSRVFSISLTTAAIRSTAMIEILRLQLDDDARVLLVEQRLLGPTDDPFHKARRARNRRLRPGRPNEGHRSLQRPLPDIRHRLQSQL